MAVYMSCDNYYLAHSKGVRGVAVDALTMEVYSGSADSTVKVWLMCPVNSYANNLYDV